ncbi:hypothetical protein BDF19DRAFT_412901 [Syncephalis fuscata]|nr:hypothetical protein BDF19DRAFT_412901 [Syncephalis fuscata]
MSSGQGGYHSHHAQAAQLFNAPADGRTAARYNNGNDSDDANSDLAYGARGGTPRGEKSTPGSRGAGNTDGHQWQGYPRNNHLDVAGNMASATPSSILDANRTPMASYAVGPTHLGSSYTPPNNYGNLGNNSSAGDSRSPLPPPHQPYVNQGNNGSNGSIIAPDAYPLYSETIPYDTHPTGNSAYNDAYQPPSNQHYGSSAPYASSTSHGGGRDERYPNPKLNQPPSHHDAYNGAGSAYYASQPQYGPMGGNDSYPMNTMSNTNNYHHAPQGSGYQASTSPYNNQPEETDKPADIWDFPDGARPSRTSVTNTQPLPPVNQAYAARPPVVGPTPIGPMQDPTGPAYGKFKLERRCCGCRQRYCIIATFFTLIAIALVLFFAWPRLPDTSISSIETTKAMVINMPDKTPVDKVSGMQGSWNVILSIDNGNFIPWPFKTVNVEVTDPHLLSNSKIGGGNKTNVKLSRGFSALKIPVDIKYNAGNASDAALLGMQNACDSGQAISLNFNVEFQISVLTFFKRTTTVGANYNCQTPKS